MQRTLKLLLALLGTATLASAVPQLDLPKSRTRPTSKKAADPAKAGATKDGKTLGRGTGDIASEKVTDKQTTQILRDKDGRPVGTATTSKLNTPGSNNKSKRRGKLMLPSKRRDLPPPNAVADGGSATAAPQTVLAPRQLSPGAGIPTGFPSTRNSARFLYDQLLKAHRPGDTEVAEAADRLARLGEDGLED